jgi:hypothetical protein
MAEVLACQEPDDVLHLISPPFPSTAVLPGIVKDRVLWDAVGFSKGDSLSSVVPPASAFLPKLTMEQLDGTQLFKVGW